MKLRTRTGDHALRDRLVWQAASLLLAYPDAAEPERLDTVEDMLIHLTGPAAALLAETLAALRDRDSLRGAEEYVDTFDLGRRTTMYLTYWTAGDTRNRGSQIHAFAQVYRDAGVEPPRNEAPDHLPVVLEFAARVDPEAGRKLLAAHRVPIDVLLRALNADGSPYAHAVAAVCETLPPVTDQRATTAANANPAVRAPASTVENP